MTRVQSDHALQPDDYQYKVRYSSSGVTFIRDQDGSVKATFVKLKHGRLTVCHTDGSDVPSLVCVQNRHVHALRILSSPPRLQLALSDVCVDLFEGANPAELERIKQIVDEELLRHQSRKQAAMPRPTLLANWHGLLSPGTGSPFASLCWFLRVRFLRFE
jgi:hypothetical protein